METWLGLNEYHDNPELHKKSEEDFEARVSKNLKVQTVDVFHLRVVGSLGKFL